MSLRAGISRTKKNIKKLENLKDDKSIKRLHKFKSNLGRMKKELLECENNKNCL